jgi:hypothetical protein
VIKDIKYIIIGIIQTILRDIKSGYDSMAKPKDIMNLLFWISIIEIMTRRYNMVIITSALYLATYIWKIVKDGKWVHIRRQTYNKKNL